MTPEQVLNLVINAGGTGVLIWLVYDMRKEVVTMNSKTWTLLNRLVEHIVTGAAADEPRQQPEYRAEMAKHGFNSPKPPTPASPGPEEQK